MIYVTKTFNRGIRKNYEIKEGKLYSGGNCIGEFKGFVSAKKLVRNLYGSGAEFVKKDGVFTDEMWISRNGSEGFFESLREDVKYRVKLVSFCSRRNKYYVSPGLEEVVEN